MKSFIITRVQADNEIGLLDPAVQAVKEEFGPISDFTMSFAVANDGKRIPHNVQRSAIPFMN